MSKKPSPHWGILAVFALLILGNFWGHCTKDRTLESMAERLETIDAGLSQMIEEYQSDPRMEDVVIKLRALKAEVGQYYDEGPEYDPDALDSYR